MLIRDMHAGRIYAVDTIGTGYFNVSHPPRTLDKHVKVRVCALVKPSARPKLPRVLSAPDADHRHAEVEVLALPDRAVRYYQALAEARVGDRLLLPASMFVAEWDEILAAQAARAAVERHRSTLKASTGEQLQTAIAALAARGIQAHSQQIHPARSPGESTQIHLGLSLAPAQLAELMQLLDVDELAVKGVMHMAAPGHTRPMR